MNGRNSSNSRQQPQQVGTNGGIPALRIQADTPQPNNDRLQFPALPTQRSIVAHGKPTQNGYQELKSPFATPKAPGPNGGIFNGQRQNKHDFANNPNFGLQGFGVSPRQKQQNFGHSSAAAFANPNPNLQISMPNNRMDSQTPTPSEISTIPSARNVHTPLSMVSGQGSDRNLHTPVSHVDKQVFLEPRPPSKGWNPYPTLPHVGNGKDSDNMSISDKQSLTDRPMASWHTHGMPGSATTRYPTSSSGTNSLSPHLAMDVSPTHSTHLGSNFTNSPRHSAQIHSRAQKRAHSLSPIGDGLQDFTKLIRASPTSLMSCLNGGASIASASPQPQGMLQQGHFGHLIARNSRNSNGSPYTGSASSANRAFSNFKIEPGLEVSDMQDYFQDIVSNQVVMPQNEIPYWEQRAFEDIQQFGAPQFNLPPENMVQPPGVNGNMSGYNSQQMNNMNNMNLSVRPPPTYDQAVGQQHPSGMMQHTPNFQPQVPTQPNNMNSLNINNLNNLNNNINTMTNNLNETLTDYQDEGEGEESGDKQHICRWIDCNVNFKEQEELVRHLEKSHIDQRKGEDFTCFWSGCQRRYKPFNARYKLLIHMRVHSGEKPNKCTFEGCTKAFSRLENLKIHLRSHTGERPYTCTHAGCPKAFSNSSDRAKHQRTHLDTKPYACNVVGCNKRYTDPSSLRKHVKNHNQKDAQQKKKLKRDGELAPPGMLNNCLTIQQLHTANVNENGQQEIYPNYNLGGPSVPNAMEQSPNTVQNSPMSVMEDSQNSVDTITSFSPAPPDMLSPGRGRPHPHLRRHMYPNMEMGMMPPAYPQADEMYQQWVENGGMHPPCKAQEPSMPQYTYNTGNCRMQNVAWQGQLEDFNLADMQRANSGFDFEGPYMMPTEEVQQQFLQMNAVDRPVSRLSGILADGTT